MQVPYRKPGKYSQIAADPSMTQAKFLELQKKLDRLKASQPAAAKEVSRLAELGDFSENVEYQLAKGRLRSINQNILNIEKQLNTADIIEAPRQYERVELGHTVTVEAAGKQKVFQILGSSETNPQQGIISQNSPIGAALLGRKVGDEVTITIAGKKVVYTLLSIE